MFISAYCWFRILLQKIHIKALLWKAVLQDGNGIAYYTLKHWKEFMKGYYESTANPLTRISAYKLVQHYHSSEWWQHAQCGLRKE